MITSEVLAGLLVVLGAFSGGFVSGLCGFGTGLAAMPFFLHAVNPVVAAQLAAICAVMGHIKTLGTVRGSLSWHHVGPITVAGLLGVPIGVWLLPSVPPVVFKFGVGCLLISFCIFILVLPATWRFQTRYRGAEVVAGFLGGFMGGLVGLPGPLATMWGTVQNWSRHDKRAMYQVFNLSTLTLMLVASAVAGQMTQTFLVAAAISVPGTIAGSICGAWMYRRVDDRRYDRIVLSILMLAGLTLVAIR